MSWEVSIALVFRCILVDKITRSRVCLRLSLQVRYLNCTPRTFMKKWLIIFLVFSAAFKSATPPLFPEGKSWVDKQMASMTLDQKIAQLIMIEVRPTYGAAHLASVKSTIDKYDVGGVIFFKGDPLEQVKLTNEYQKMSKVPLMVAIDGEWGLAMRLSNTTSYPYQMGLGGIRDNHVIYEMGRQIGRDCQRMGIHVNFAPVVDINNNPNNPVINYRSFGENKFNVAAKGWAYAKGMQDEKVIACAKHFPGHGDTDVDSHKDLPVIKHNMKRLEDVEMHPFKVLIDSGVMSVMTAHLYIPAIDKRKNVAISISDKAINGILRDKLRFQGLAFTDALNMQGVAKYHETGALEVKALEAGNDILLGPVDVGKAITMIKNAIDDGTLKLDYIENKVRKVLHAKYFVGLNKFEPIQEYGLEQDLNSGYSTYLLNKLIEKQVCVVRNEKGLLPIDVADDLRIATVAIGASATTEFQKTISKYHDATHFHTASSTSGSALVELERELRDYDLVIASLHGTSKFPYKNYKVNPQSGKILEAIGKRVAVVFVDFGNPYNLKYFQGQHTVVMGYEDRDVHHQKTAQALFGAIGVDARLSVTVGDYKEGEGVSYKSLPLLQYGVPEEVGMNSELMKKIDKVAEEAISIKATPGCQVLVARHGKVIWEKSYGYHTYSKKRHVQNEDLYDIASLTKVAATTISLMKLEEDGVIDLDDEMSRYLGDLDTTNKKKITIRDVLTHSSGLKGWIPFYRATVADPIAYDSIYHTTPDDRFCIKVDDDLYMCKDYQEVIFGEIYTSDVDRPGDYRYSDLGMILLRYLVEKVTHTPFDRYVDSVFYQPMGLRKLTYHPLRKFSKDEIVPTERDADFRKGVIHGYVHDPGAAMLGGVSGHAGLFSNASDLAALMQMLMYGGVYNGYRFLHPKTVKQFTSYQMRGSRRGLGFDKPEPSSRKINPTSDYASGLTFGHSGFTGTQMWADPQYGLVYIFLSNRVHPSANNKLLIRKSVRTEIMNAIYESIKGEKLEG